MIIIYSKSSTF